MSINHMLQYFNLDEIDLLFIENIGNLVCPAEFNIGEDFRIAILSIPEGDDKVEKYPLMFSSSQCLVMNKFDMIKYFDFDDGKVEKIARDANPYIDVFRVSSKDETGMEELTEYLISKISNKINQ